VTTWTNSGLLDKAKERFDELKHKGWEWRSFCNGFLEGASEALEYAKTHPLDQQDGNRLGKVDGMETVNLPKEHLEEREWDE